MNKSEQALSAETLSVIAWILGPVDFILSLAQFLLQRQRITILENSRWSYPIWVSSLVLQPFLTITLALVQEKLQVLNKDGSLPVCTTIIFSTFLEASYLLFLILSVH